MPTKDNVGDFFSLQHIIDISLLLNILKNKVIKKEESRVFP